MATGAVAEGVTVDADRRDLFVSILEENDCRMHNFYPADGILAAVDEHGFKRDEIRAIGRNLLETGAAARDGDFLVLQTEECK